MRRLFGWLAGAVGGAAVYRALRRRSEPATLEAPRADELRAKLAAARDAADEGQDNDEGDETSARSAKAEPLDPDARRRAVHEQGRAAIDELRGE